MRLTLRTLLAHLDRTLDPDDDAAIAAKLRESDFASKLAERVRACLQSDTLESPSPTATGTADDPNRIGEYLDSVLSSEQVAEVERICLESDAHLAEVASCHQILTLVLAKPAEIPASLRTKLYGLSQDSQTELSSSNGTFSEPVAPLVAEIASSETVISPAGMAVVKPADSAAPILPVGPDDSGVSDAPTRLKEHGTLLPRAATAEPALAGSKKLSPADLSDFSGRPSRVVPWLVSLGLIAAFLFVASQAFAPLLQRRGADQERSLTLGDSAPPPAAQQQPLPAEPAATATPSDSEARLPRTTDQPEAPGLGAQSPGPETPTTEPPSSAPQSPAPPITAPADPATAVDAADPVLSPAGPRPTASPPAVAPPGERGDVLPPAVEEVAVPEIASAPDGGVPTSDSPLMVPPAVASRPDSPPDPAAVIPAEDARDGVADEEPIVIISEDTLLLVRDGDSDTWMLGQFDDVVQPGSELICPPLYRDRLSIHEQVELTMVGPARVTLQQAADQIADLILEYGRFLLVGTGDQRQISIRFEDTVSVLTLPTPESIVAIQVRAVRPAGMDPENPSATQRVIQVWAVAGAPRWRSGNRPEVTLESGQLLTLARGNQVSLSDASVIPNWLDEPVEAVASIESSARDGLLGLVRGNEAIELSLREAMDFRRAEVGALAAQTLLLLDRHDVYFGSEGVFSQVRQRTNWPEHFNAMLGAIDRGPESAAAVRGSIERMDAAQADEIYRLLWLYSDNQLAAGADEKLVQALDSSNMTIRVLAAENLRHITGNTLLYKPEVETASRRASDIKKWETRLRRGEIRWSTPPRPEADEDSDDEN